MNAAARHGGLRGGAALLLCAALSLPVAAAGRADSGEQDGLQAAATFAMVWDKLRDSGFDDDHDDIDWAALEARHRPAIEHAEDLPTLRREIGRLLRAVGVSHLSLIPAEAVPAPSPRDADHHRDGDHSPGSASATTAADKSKNGSSRAAREGTRGQTPSENDAEAAQDTDDAPASLGLRVVSLSGALHVLSVTPGSAAAHAGIRPGWQVEAIDDWTLAPALAALDAQPQGPERRRAVLQFEHHANDRLSSLESGEDVVLRVRDAAARPHRIELTARRSTGTQLKLMPGMPPMVLHYTAHRLDQPGSGCTLHVGFDLWAQPAFDRLAATLLEQPDCERLVLDLRGNPGGQMWAMTAIGGLLYDKTTSLGTMKTTDGSLRLTVLPRRVANDGTPLRRLRGPVAVLIDRGSASSSEIFTAGLQATGRARVFGETSAGMALPAITVRLPSGDWLYYPTADMTDPDGRRIEGLGVVPDVPIAPTVASLYAGKDTTLAAALAWVASEASGPAATTTGGTH